MDAIHLADLLGQTTGAVMAGGIVTALVSALKTYLPPVDDWNGMVMAFAAASVLYVLVAIQLQAYSLDAAFAVFMSWLACLGASTLGHKYVVKPIAEKVAA